MKCFTKRNPVTVVIHESLDPVDLLTDLLDRQPRHTTLVDTPAELLREVLAECRDLRRAQAQYAELMCGLHVKLDDAWRQLRKLTGEVD